MKDSPFTMGRASFPSLILLLTVIQLRGGEANFDLHPNAFDDQYICCSRSLEAEIMPRLLTKELSVNRKFRDAWGKAEEKWEEFSIFLSYHGVDPAMFNDKYAIALILYSMDDPEVQPVLEQFNADMKRAGLSKREYMDNFHFKALHFYLTKGLQVYSIKHKAKCHVFTTYHIPDNATHIFRFGTFAKVKHATENITLLVSSSNYVYNSSTFQIPYSNETSKIIFPISELFFYVGDTGEHKYISSSGQKCSFYNCAYLPEGKNKSMSCSPESERTDTCSSATRRTVLFQEFSHVFPGFILAINAAFAKLVWAF
uniref:NAD(P)(+)--arginine ADP-ribosyltransferase n=1 Tax=Leptobrachium leishanense TaxID=445787 RepID=A0A8C5PAU5_9ANUR